MLTYKSTIKLRAGEVIDVGVSEVRAGGETNGLTQDAIKQHTRTHSHDSGGDVLNQEFDLALDHDAAAALEPFQPKSMASPRRAFAAWLRARAAGAPDAPPNAHERMRGIRPKPRPQRIPCVPYGLQGVTKLDALVGVQDAATTCVGLKMQVGSNHNALSQAFIDSMTQTAQDVFQCIDSHLVEQQITLGATGTQAEVQVH